MWLVPLRHRNRHWGPACHGSPVAFFAPLGLVALCPSRWFSPPAGWAAANFRFVKMGLFTKKGKGLPFSFVIHVHTLSPWPAKTGSLCVSYERGSKTGVLRRAAPPSSPSAAGHGTVVFEEEFDMPATLYAVRLPLPPLPA